MTFPPKIGWIINPEPKSMPINKKPFFIAFAAAPPLLPIIPPHQNYSKGKLPARSILFFERNDFSFFLLSIRLNRVFPFLSHFDKIRPKIRGMEPLEYFSDLFRKIGTPNFLMIGVVILILWLLLSGIRKGLRKGGQEKERPEKNGED
jgi:hypothetical protein